MEFAGREKAEATDQGVYVVTLAQQLAEALEEQEGSGGLPNMQVWLGYVAVPLRRQ
jgi:hypothetical protein